MSLLEFVRESNRIEGINRQPTTTETKAHDIILGLNEIDIGDLEAFVESVQPGAILRKRVGLNVRVGDHIAPRGGPKIVDELSAILADTLDGDPYAVHQRYETLHPFTDGNGRSGRAIWLWMMDKRGQLDRALALGFLHNWYYQSLSANRTA